MPIEELVPAVEALREEKRALLRTLAAQRAAVSELSKLLDEIEAKFLPVKIYRSTLAVPYTVTRNGRQYIEYRVWAHSYGRGNYPLEVMEEWYFKLLDLFPPLQAELLGVLSDVSLAGYEGDEEIEPDEVTPKDAKMDKVYGAATYTPWLYLAEQTNGELEKLGETVISPEAVKKLLGRFGVELPEDVLRARGRKHRGR